MPGSESEQIAIQHESENLPEQQKSAESAADRWLAECSEPRTENLEDAMSVSQGDQIALNRLGENVELSHASEYQEYLGAIGTLEHSATQKAFVDPERIAAPEVVNPDWSAHTPRFWDHHGRSREAYLGLAEKYPQLQERLAAGAQVEDLKRDPELGHAAEFWYSEEPVNLTKYGETYFVEAGIHRVTLAKELHLGEIPATVREALQKHR